MSNIAIFTGRILKNSENAPHNYMFMPANGDKKAFLRITISTQKPGNQKDENGYYKTFFVPVKAFGGTAELINTYVGEGGKLTVQGKMDMSDEYTSPEGKVYAPRMELIADTVWLEASQGQQQNATAATGVAQRQTNARPAAPVRQMGQQRKTPF